MGRVVTMGRGRPLSVFARRRRLREALTASAPLDTTFVLEGSLGERRYYELVLAGGLAEAVGDQWPSEAATLGEVPGAVFRDGQEVVTVGRDGTVTYIRLGHGWVVVRAASPSRQAAADACSTYRGMYPASYLAEDSGRVPITFWNMSTFGPQPRLRKVEAAAWADVARNYTAPVRAELDRLMGWSEPGSDGQLLLWQGPPGTGKTWALRALASEWAPWAEFHYITDPDAFFVTEPSYMVNVLLSDSYATVEAETGDVYQEADPLGKWRVLILEDTGELLAANAKESYGQGLSRLLNVVDGMIGQGLRVLALVTTNDELGDLHPAVSRPGRCASQIEFGALTAAETSEWLGEDVGEGLTLAEIYARLSARPDAPEAPAASHGLVEVAPGWAVPADALDAAIALAKSETVQEAIARVAEQHEPEGGYGETAWHPDMEAVFWNAADWSSQEDVDAARSAFLSLDGVERFESDAEVDISGYCPAVDGWEIVWPEAMTASAYARLVAFARSPLEGQ